MTAAETGSRLTAWIVVAIVAGTVIAGLIVGAQRADNRPATLIIENGHVYTPDAPDATAQAVAIRGNQIIRVGTNRQIEQLRSSRTDIIDAHGGTILPGFEDTHVQALGDLATSPKASAAGVDLSDATTPALMAQRIRAFADAHRDLPWITGGGWTESVLGAGSSWRARLDALVPERPVLLLSADGLAGLANSQALDLAGISRDTPDPIGGTIGRNPRSGLPTGLLRGAAVRLMDAVLPVTAPPAKAIAALAERAHQAGVTSVQIVGATPGDLAAYAAARRAGQLTLRVTLALAVPPGFTEADAKHADDLRDELADDPLLASGAVWLNASTLADGPSASGFSPADLTRVAALMDQHGWQVRIQAEGRGTSAAIEALLHAIQVNPLPARGRRNRIDHRGPLDRTALAAIADADVIDAQQLEHTRLTARLFDWAALPRTGAAPDPWQMLADEGGRLVLGSGWPGAPLSPLTGIAAALDSDEPETTDAWPTWQTLRLRAAIDGYTRNAAYSSFDEHRKGTLEPGMLADLVILSRDIFSGSPSEIDDTTVQTTIFDGTVVYTRPTETTTNQTETITNQPEPRTHPPETATKP
jgi:predicted amidohydrolase YtcJ